MIQGPQARTAFTKEMKGTLAADEKTIAINKQLAEAMGIEYDATAASLELVRNELELIMAHGEAVDTKTREEVEARFNALIKQKAKEDTEKKVAEDIKKATEEAADELHSALSDSVYRAIDEGGRAGLDNLADYFKNKIKKQLADELASAMMGGGGGAGLLGMFGGAGGQGQTTGGITGAAGMAGIAGGGKGGGLFGKSGGLSFFGGGLGGILGGVMGISMLAGMFSKSGQKAALSGVDQIFSGANIRTDSGALFGSEAFERAAFSSRNRTGAMTSEWMNARRGGEQEVKVTVKAGPEFDVTVEQSTTGKLKTNDLAGVVRRSGFNHG
jgi:hypothetical protein